MNEIGLLRERSQLFRERLTSDEFDPSTQDSQAQKSRSFDPEGTIQHHRLMCSEYESADPSTHDSRVQKPRRPWGYDSRPWGYDSKPPADALRVWVCRSFDSRLTSQAAKCTIWPKRTLSIDSRWFHPTCGHTYRSRSYTSPIFHARWRSTSLHADLLCKLAAEHCLHNLAGDKWLSVSKYTFRNNRKSYA